MQNGNNQRDTDIDEVSLDEVLEEIHQLKNQRQADQLKLKNLEDSYQKIFDKNQSLTKMVSQQKLVLQQVRFIVFLNIMVYYCDY